MFHSCLSRRNAVALAALLAAASCLTASPAFAGPVEYTVVDLGVLPGGDTSAGRALTYSGIAAGISNDGTGHSQAFYWQAGTRVPLGTLPGYTDSQADGAVDFLFSPIVVGWAFTPTATGPYPARAMVSVFGFTLDLGSLGGDHSQAHGIAGQGFIAGSSEITPGSPVTHAFRTFPYSFINPATDDLGTLPGASQSFGTAVNNRAQVTGQSGSHAYRTASWAKIMPGDDLGTLGGSFSIGSAINDAGEVAGISTIAAISPVSGRPIDHAFLYDATGLHDLGTLPGYENSAGAGISGAHRVVGFVANFGGPNTGGLSDVQAMIWDKAHGMRNLNDLIPSGSGWNLLAAIAINERGQITGWGIRGGQQHGYILNPRKH